MYSQWKETLGKWGSAPSELTIHGWLGDTENKENPTHRDMEPKLTICGW